MKLGKKLTPAEEARKFDKQRFGAEAELTTEEKERIKIRTDNIQAGDVKGKKDRLDSIKGFDTDPISFLKEKLGAGDYVGRDKQHNYLILTTLVKIQQSLESPDLNLLSRK